MKTSSLSAILLAASALAAPAITVSNVSVSQNLSTRTVTVNYTLDAPAFVRCDILTNGVSIGRAHLKTFSGNYSTDSSKTNAAGARAFSWQALNDWPNHLVGDLQVKVYAYEPTAADLAALAKTEQAFEYIFIDLSGGASASSYPVTYSDTITTGSAYRTTKLALKRIPAGSVYSETGDYTIVQTKPYYIGIWEFTIKQWKQVMGSYSQGSTSFSGDEQGAHASYYTIRGAGKDGYPADKSVGTDSLLGKLRAKTGLALDLPCEMQWEYAGRAGSTKKYCTGSDSWPADYIDRTFTIGNTKPNAFGIYDVHGGYTEIMANNRESWTDLYACFNGRTLTDYEGIVRTSTTYVNTRCGNGWSNESMHSFEHRYVQTYTRNDVINGVSFRLCLPPQ